MDAIFAFLAAHPHVAMVAVLAAMVAFVVLTLRQRSHDATSGFQLDDLLLGDDGKASKSAVVMWGAFALTSWMMVALLLREKMTEGYLGAYLAAWVAPAVTKLIVGGKS